MMKTEKEHKAYLKKQGRFIIDCNTNAFSNEEIEILEKWGNWFNALCDEILVPFTMKQEIFIRTAKGELEPVSIEEQAWCKYLGTKNSESRPGDEQNKEYLPYEDTFYNRDMYKQNRKMMFGVMRDNHRK
jgi:uncharacterized protein